MADEVGCFGKTQKKREKSLKKERLRNSKILLGDTRDISLNVRLLFELGLPENLSKCSSFFAPFESTPEEFDKLWFERQTFPQWKVQREFQKLHYRQRTRLKKRKIYILPIGPFPSFVLQNIPGLTTSLFELLSNFISVFYLGFSVEIMEVKDLNEISCQTRVHPGTGKLQILVEDVLSHLKKHRPSDGFCVIGISWQDLYPGDEWNFVLGEASCEDGCAAISFGHHEPKPSEKLSALKTLANSRDHNDETFEVKDERNQNFDDNQWKSSSAKKECLNNLDLPGDENRVFDNKIHGDTKLTKKLTKDRIVSSKHEKETHYGISTSRNISSHIKGSIKDLAVDGGVKNAVVKSGQESCSDLQNDSGWEKIDAFEIWKFFRVVSHELGHIFGITHCSYFSCAMNESNSIAEAVNQPLFTCPVCLRKIQYAAGFDVVDRYNRLRHFLATLHSDLSQDGMKGKGNNSDHIPRDQRTNDENFGGRELGNMSEAVDWIDSVLNFLQEE